MPVKLEWKASTSGPSITSAFTAGLSALEALDVPNSRADFFSVSVLPHFNNGSPEIALENYLVGLNLEKWLLRFRMSRYN